MKSHRAISALTFALLLALWAVPARAQEEEELAPLDGVIADMQVAGGRLGKMLTDKVTQQKEQEVIDKLSSLIKLLEQKRQQQGGISPNPEKPADESNIRSGPGGSGPLHDANRKGRGWGQLPAHKRQQILQSMTEGFPAHYQQLLERYYRRLAEEKPAGEVGEDNTGPAAGKTEPAAATRKKAPAVAMEKPGAAAGKPATAEQATP